MKNMRSNDQAAHGATGTRVESVRGFTVAGIAAIFAVATIGSGCAGAVAVGSAQRAAARSAPSATALDADVAGLLEEANETDREFRSRGLVVEDDAGLQGLVNAALGGLPSGPFGGHEIASRVPAP